SGVTVARPIALRTVSARSESARERHRGSSGARTRRGASRLLEYDAAQRSVRAGAVRWAPHGGASGGCVAAVSLARLASRAGNSRSRSNSVADAPSRGGSRCGIRALPFRLAEPYGSRRRNWGATVSL